MSTSASTGQCVERTELTIDDACLPAVLPGKETAERPRAEKALRFAASIMVCEFPWYVSSQQFVMLPNAPGNCLYVPPAVLLDIDDSFRESAKQWSLQIAVFDHPNTGAPFTHCWLSYRDIAVSVSGLDAGRPLIAVPTDSYLRMNRCQNGPVRITRRRLRAQALALGISPGLARWISGRTDDEPNSQRRESWLNERLPVPL